MSVVQQQSPLEERVGRESPPKRVLMLTHRFPFPPNRGDRIRSYNLLRILSSVFDVTLACPVDEPIASSEFAHVQALCSSVITAPTTFGQWFRAFASMVRGASLSEGLFCVPSLRRQIVAMQSQEPFDAVLVFCSSMYPYVRDSSFKKTTQTVDVVDVDSEKWRQMGERRRGMRGRLYRLESQRVRKLEKEIGSRADSVTLVSDVEAKLFDSVAFPKRPSIGVSNGVDAAYYDRGDRSHPSGNELNLVFTGVMDYPPNVEGVCWLCENVLSHLSREYDVCFNIVGRNPSRKVLELGRAPYVNVVGAVADVRPFLHHASIAVAPLHLARGIQNKVLEAMAAGLPVVATPQSADGIEAVPGEHLLVAETPDQWRESLLSLTQDHDYRIRLGKAARKLVVDHYTWNARLNPIAELLNAQRVV